jgi:hypothetical protein
MDDDTQPLVIRRLPRRSVLQMLAGTAVAGAIPAVATGHPILRHLADEAAVAQAQARSSAAGWKPEFLDQHQFETLQSIAERLLPGASRAGASEFVDQLLAVDSQEDRRRFLSALGAFEGRALQRAGRPWKELTESDQHAILTEASTMAPGTPPDKPWTRGEPILPPPETSGPTRVTLRDHFDLLKGWIAGAYYSSEIGMKELGWTGNVFFESYPGCEHPGGHA